MPSYTPWKWSEPHRRHYCYLLADDGTTVLQTRWDGEGRQASPDLATPQIANVPAVRTGRGGILIRRATDGVYPGLYTGSSTTSGTTFQAGQHVEIADRNKLPFQCVGTLGSGASAIVEIVVDRIGQQFACKKFHTYYGSNFAKIKEDFRNEIEIMKRLQSHQHIIDVFGSYACGRELGIILLPVANGGDLRAYLGTIRDTGSLTSAQEAILDRAFGCLARGLAFIHKHTIRHKDIKPSNILIHNGFVIYTDFGISHDASELDSTETTGPPGAFTRRYCAPEVIGSQPRNRKSDVFSLGCVFVEIMTVFFPDVDLGNMTLEPYWQRVDHIRYALYMNRGRDALFPICQAMLEPTSANRMTAQEVVRRLPPVSCDLCARNEQ